jgi:hypothetical protein
MIPKLRIENVKGKILLVTDQGEIIPADMVTIRMQRGGPTTILAESKNGERAPFNYDVFYANAGFG